MISMKTSITKRKIIKIRIKMEDWLIMKGRKKLNSPILN
jgi:hypothetical protein